MFFGSGNLVFPILVGLASEGHYVLSSLGILLTGVLVPFLGVFALFLFKGDQVAFFSRLGAKTTFWFTLFCLSIMGPFGVMARCITVAHASFTPIYSINLPLFSILFSTLIFYFAANKSRIISRLGNILTPVLLLSLIAIAYFGLKNATLPAATAGMGWASFKDGLFQGYQTMDLLAAFFFSVFIIKSLEQYAGENEKRALKTFIIAALIAAGLLSAIYFVLVMLGSSYSAVIAHLQPEQMLSAIVHSALGPLAGPIVCIAVVLACLTTAVVLATLSADFLRTSICKNKLSNNWALLVILALGFATSSLGFAGIASFIGPILETIYPALIVFTVLNICYKLFGLKMVRTPTAASLLLHFWI